MCTACGRPQRAGPLRCEACATRLPEVPRPHGTRGGDSAAQVASLRNRSLGVRGESLEWRAGGRLRRFQLGTGGVREVRLLQRPLFEALAVGICVAVGLALLPSLLARLALLPVVLLSLAACFLERRYRLEVRWEHGERAALSLGTGHLRQGRELRRGLQRLTGALNAHGVSVPLV